MTLLEHKGWTKVTPRGPFQSQPFCEALQGLDTDNWVLTGADVSELVSSDRSLLVLPLLLCGCAEKKQNK